MADKELTRILAELVRTQAATRQPSFEQVTGLSNAVLAGAGLQEPYQSEATKNKDVKGPSFVNRIMDILSRPLYGVLNTAKGQIERDKGKSLPDAVLSGARALSPITNPEGLKDFWGGFSGQDKTTGKDIIGLGEQRVGGKLPGPAKFALGLGIDIAADPLTYVGGIGLGSKVGKAARESTAALSAVEKGTGEAAQSISEQISRRAAEQATKLNVTVPTKGMPAPPIDAPPRLFEAGPGPTNLKTSDPLSASLPPSTTAPSLSPTVKPLELTAGPQPGQMAPLDVLKDMLEGGNTAKSQFANLAEKLPENANSLDAIRILNEQIAATKSPVAKSILRKQLEKLQAGVKPADLLSEARTIPPEFPALTIGERWINTARTAAQSFLKNNRMKNINHVGQTNLYNKIVHSASKVRKDRRQFHVLQMLRIAEEELLAQGRHLVDAEGISVRLSDVANIAGGARVLTPKLVDDFRKARPSQQVEDLKAFTTPQVASEILDPVVETGAKITEAIKDLPPSQTVMIGSNLSKELAKLAEKAGASSKEAKTAKSFIDELYNPVRDKLYTKIQQEARALVRQSTTGTINPDTLHRISMKTYEVLGANPKMLGKLPQQNKVVEAIMTKFATWWGAKDIKPFSREYIDTARNVAAAFAETMTPLVRATTPTARKSAWSVAQGKLTAGTPEEQELANQFKYLTERLMGTHGIKENAEAVVLRSGTLMKELNDELPKALQFTNGKGADDLGRKYDYSNGDWMHSWKEWSGGEPAESLYQLTRALQLVTRKNSMWDDAAARWGMPIKGAEFQHEATGIERLKGSYFPKEIADQLTSLQTQLKRDVFKAPHKSIKLFDQVQRMWKTGVTIYSPSHHIRNLNGDIYLAALDGVVSPKPYAIATKVLHAFPTRYKDMESVFNIMDPKLRDLALQAKPGNVVLTTKRGDKVTAEQLYQAAESQGLFIRAMHAEDLMGDAAPAFGTFGAGFAPLGGKVHGAATKISELRDHWVRLAHFSDILSKSRSPLPVAIEEAAKRVRKFHPDGMDLTGFEQNVMRRVIPFYSWLRKATPLVFEGAIMRPQITMAYPKTMANLQSLTGIESEGPADPFPMDQMFPDWIKEKGIGPVLQPGSGLGRDETWRGEAPGYTNINPSTPFMDQLTQVGSPQKTLFGSLSPAARIPIELLTGQNALGIPLESVEGGVPGYLAQQVPAVGIGARITGATRDNEPYNPEQLINWLTAAGVTGTGPYQPQAQTEIRQYLEEIAKKKRGDYR